MEVLQENNLRSAQHGFLNRLREETRADHDKVDRHPMISKIMAGDASLQDLKQFTARQAEWLKDNFIFLDQSAGPKLGLEGYDLQSRLSWLAGTNLSRKSFYTDEDSDPASLIGLIYVSDGSLKGLQMTNRLFSRIYPGFESPLQVEPRSLAQWWLESERIINESNLSHTEQVRAVQKAKEFFRRAQQSLLPDQ